MRSVRFCALILAAAWLPVHARVVINEILYHPPEEAAGAEFIELHNSGKDEVNLNGWKFSKGIQYRFASPARIPANGYFVLAHNKEAFQKIYGFEPNAVFEESLKDKGEKLELTDGAGQKVDAVKFKDGAPWPLSPDGHGTTLERIAVEGESDSAHNWAPGPFGADASKPGGTPGKQNASFAVSLPPVITEVTFTPKKPGPAEAVTVTAKLGKGSSAETVQVVYRIAGAGSEKPEEVIAMSTQEGGRSFSAKIPAQAENSIVRFRVEAVKGSVRRVEPAPFELRPAYSYFVHDKFSASRIPWGFLVFVDEADYKKEETRPKREGPGMAPGDRDAFMARAMFEENTDLTPVWTSLCLTQQLSHTQLAKAREGIARQIDFRDQTLGKFRQSPAPTEPLKQARDWNESFQQNTRAALEPVLTDAQRSTLSAWQSTRTNNSRPNFTPEKVLQRFCNVEGALLFLTTRSNLSEPAFEKIKAVSAQTLADRAKFVERVRAVMQAQDDEGGDKLVAEVRELHDRVGTELAAASNDESVRREFQAWREANNPFNNMGPGGGAAPGPDPARGNNAFVYVAAETGEPELFDYVRATGRNAGYKVHFTKNQPLRGMSGINLLFEYQERFVLAEPLAYEVYRRAGNAAEQTDFIRLSVNGRQLGYHLLLEQPNRSFLRRNKLRDDGNLYKILWYQQGVVGQHEKKTNPQSGHDDIVKLVESLEKTKGAEQWAVIKSNFNVDQVATYFAVNMILSHWDGFFNNYLTYHDVHGTGKWEMYPWDQDKTWGFHDALPEGTIFFDMPLTFGMEGDRPPGYPADRPAPRNFNGNGWWRPGGYFSKPLLANAEFRKVFLAKTRYILENVYTEKAFFPVIDQVRDRLQDEVAVRADVLKLKPEEARAQFDRDINLLKEHLTKRREFLLAQDELKSASKL